MPRFVHDVPLPRFVSHWMRQPLTGAVGAGVAVAVGGATVFVAVGGALVGVAVGAGWVAVAVGGEGEPLAPPPGAHTWIPSSTLPSGH